MSKSAAETLDGAAHLSTLLRVKRAGLGLTLREAARDVGIDTGTYFRIESKAVMPGARNLLALCRWLGVSVEYALIGREPNGAGCSRCIALQARLDRIAAAAVR